MYNIVFTPFFILYWYLFFGIYALLFRNIYWTDYYEMLVWIQVRGRTQDFSVSWTLQEDIIQHLVYFSENNLKNYEKVQLGWRSK